MNKYESVIIVNPNVEENALKELIERFQTLINTDGKVEQVNELGKKKLAYEIKDFKSGYYFVFEVEAKDDKAIKEFDRLALINNDIVRHLITKVEE